MGTMEGKSVGGKPKKKKKKKKFRGSSNDSFNCTPLNVRQSQAGSG